MDYYTTKTNYLDDDQVWRQRMWQQRQEVTGGLSRTFSGSADNLTGLGAPPMMSTPGSYCQGCCQKMASPYHTGHKIDDDITYRALPTLYSTTFTSSPTSSSNLSYLTSRRYPYSHTMSDLADELRHVHDREEILADSRKPIYTPRVVETTYNDSMYSGRRSQTPERPSYYERRRRSMSEIPYIPRVSAFEIHPELTSVRRNQDFPFKTYKAPYIPYTPYKNIIYPQGSYRLNPNWDTYKPYEYRFRQSRYLLEPARQFHPVKELEMDRIWKARHLEKFFPKRDKIVQATKKVIDSGINLVKGLAAGSSKKEEPMTTARHLHHTTLSPKERQHDVTEKEQVTPNDISNKVEAETSESIQDIQEPEAEVEELTAKQEEMETKEPDLEDQVDNQTEPESQPVEPEPEPEPVESKPVKSKPVKSKPVKSKTVEPKPVEPEPVEPEPVELEAVEPEPVEPEPVEPEPVEPKPVEPEPAEPEPVEPEPVEPEPVEPEPVEPEPVEPEPVEPEPVEPEPVESKTVDPVDPEQQKQPTEEEILEDINKYNEEMPAEEQIVLNDEQPKQEEEMTIVTQTTSEAPQLPSTTTTTHENITIEEEFDLNATKTGQTLVEERDLGSNECIRTEYEVEEILVNDEEH